MSKVSAAVRKASNRVFHDAGCADGDCVFGSPGGMHTNGGCQCLKTRSLAELRHMAMKLSRVCHELVYREQRAASILSGAGDFIQALDANASYDMSMADEDFCRMVEDYDPDGDEP